MDHTLAYKRYDMKKGFRFVLCLPVVCVWLAAASFALKWFGNMARGTITYTSEGAAVIVPLLSGLTLFGALCCLVSLVVTCLGKMKLRWQILVFCAGLIFLWLIVGN